jgi:HEAT repeat protein
MIRALMSFVVVALLTVALEPSRAGAEPAADPVATVIDLLGRDDAEFREIGLDRVRHGLSGHAATTSIAGLVSKAAPPRQIELVRALADRGDAAAVPAVLALLLASPEADVRSSAILALGKLGSGTEVAVLKKALGGQDPERSAARRALERLRGADVGKQVAEAARHGEPALRPTFIEILATRRDRSAAPDLVALAADADEPVRLAALKAVAKLGGPDQLGGVVDAVIKAKSAGERGEAERAVVAICTTNTDPGRATELFLERFKAAGEADREALLPTLGRIGGPGALAIVDGLIADSDAAKRQFGLKAITRWPDATVSQRLLELVGKAQNPEERSQLVAALIRIAPLPDNKLDDRQKLELVKKTMDLCSSDEERARLLERVNAIRTVEAFRFVLPYVDQPAFVEPACSSVVELAHHQKLRDAHKDEFVKALDKVIATTKNPELVERAERYKQGKTWERKKG